MVSGVNILAILLGTVVAAALAVIVFLYILIPLLKGIGWLIGSFFWLIGATVKHIARFVVGMFRDTFRAIGAVPAGIIFMILSVVNVVIGRWSAASHYGSNVQHEIKTLIGCIYRVGIGHPLRLIGLAPMLEGLEQRVPNAMAEAPGADKPSRRTGAFDGYTIVGSLPGGGSGGKLYIAEPVDQKRETLIKSNGGCPDRVVIKSFAVADGSSLPQIVRESRALESAKKIGLVLEHELTEERFFYVMPYVPGESLGAVTRQMHAETGEVGLSETQTRQALGYISDILHTLNTYHRGGLWHKDIKPDNIIIHNGRATVVDLGLVTPLRSAMTLTTHGTEYFRDPEMVRMALRGVKVHEVDGAKFDLYAAGAVLFYLIENTFPSHGGLSVISRRCPDSVKWIVRRSMADYNNRYPTVQAMLDDVEAIRNADSMARVKPVDLPSMSGLDGNARAAAAQSFGASPANARYAAGGAAAGARFGQGGGLGETAGRPQYGAAGVRQRGGGRRSPRIRVINWWTGACRPDGGGDAVTPETPMPERGGPDPTLNQEPALRWRDARQRGPVVIGAGAIRIDTDQIRRKAAELRDRIVQAGGQARAEVQQAVDQAAADVDRSVNHTVGAGSPRPPRTDGRPARVQVASARRRAAQMRHRARKRSRSASRAPAEHITAGVLVAGLVVAATIAFGVLWRSASPRGFVVRGSDGHEKKIVIGPGGVAPMVTGPSDQSFAVMSDEELRELVQMATGGLIDVLPDAVDVTDDPPSSSFRLEIGSNGRTVVTASGDTASVAEPARVSTEAERSILAELGMIKQELDARLPLAAEWPVMIINEHPGAIRDEVAKSVSAGMQVLEQLGFARAAEVDTDLEGAIRLAVSEHAADLMDPTGIPSELARAEVAGRLSGSDKNACDACLILWVYADQTAPEGAQNTRFWLVMPDDVPQDLTLRIERLLNILVAAMH